MLKNKGFFDDIRNKKASGFPNDYELQSNGKVVYDRASSLTWQQSGSDNPMTYENAKAYIAQLNRDQFAGYSDWRLPTLEEAMSLMEPEKNNDDLLHIFTKNIDSIFDGKQSPVWTSDLYSASFAWVVDFYNGYCGSYGSLVFDSLNNYVRAVR